LTGEIWNARHPAALKRCSLIPRMSKLKLAIVIGSIRPNRFAGHAAQWIEEAVRRRGDLEVELIDARIPLHCGTAIGLMALVFFSDRSDRDDETNRATER
jgi:NAD(P)H-dependent FMN reductase